MPIDAVSDDRTNASCCSRGKLDLLQRATAKGKTPPAKPEAFCQRLRIEQKQRIVRAWQAAAAWRLASLQRASAASRRRP
jgi:hypothetical protein